jgi:2-oxoglutarate dehydrogenase E1 component
LVRIEQLYPFPKEQVSAIIKKYKNAKTVLWAQEEPVNMGPWEFVRRQLILDVNIKIIARPASGSPASGSAKFHVIRQQKIVDKVFEECNCPFLEKDCEMVCIGNKWKSFEKELVDLHLDKMDSKFHSGIKPLK